MNTWKLLLLCLLVWAGPYISNAQCVTPLETVRFDTTFTGAGNASHSFTFPKFDAALGNLIEVVVRSEVTLHYRFELENKESVPINNYRVRVVRDDEISGNTLPTPVYNSHQATYGPYTLSAFDGVAGSGPDYISVGPVYALNRQMIERTLYNTADYLGSGNVNMDYAASTYSTVFGSVNYNFNGTAEDTVRMTVTYRYCATWSLPAEISSFTASRAGDEAVDLRWTVQNEVTNRSYVVEKSADGRNFVPVTTIGSAPAAGASSYRHQYLAGKKETGKIIFRLKQTEADGTVKYSALRVVEIRKNGRNNFLLYPNPTSGNFNVLFHNTKRGEWKVEVMNMSGQVLKQFDFTKSLTGRIQLQQEFPRGSYFIRITDRKSGDQATLPMVLK